MIKEQDKAVLKKMISLNMRAIGNFLLEDGKITEARTTFKKALIYSLSIACLTKCLVSLLPLKLSKWINNKYSELKSSKQFRNNF